MTLASELTRELQRDLADPGAWPWPATGPETHQTHASLVLLAGDRALKIKKPVDLGFLDYSTRERRLRACRTEVSLNRRLAPDTYLGVVAVTRGADGRWRVAEREPGPDDEPAVLMRRFPSDRTLAALLRSGRVDEATIRRVARRLAAFHEAAEAGEEVRASSGWDTLARVVRDNLAQCAPFQGRTLEAELFGALRAETERELEAVRELVERRRARGMGRDGHGDLRLDHVVLLDDSPGGVVVVDCIEFRDDFRRGDPVGDIAFLVMELEFEGHADLGRVLFDEWAAARHDEEARALLPLQVAYRHVVRGKVRSIESGEEEVPRAARREAAERARAHFLAALVTMAGPARRPALVLTCGLPGSGKSTVARGLELEAGFVRVSSDETRKQLASSVPADARDGGLDGGLYSREWTDRTYAACLHRADELLLRGGRVVADASFHEASRRASFLDLARRRHVPALVLECAVDDATARERLERRTGDASDADARVRALIASRREAATDAERAAWREIPTSGSVNESVARAIAALRDAGLG